MNERIRNVFRSPESWELSSAFRRYLCDGAEKKKLSFDILDVGKRYGEHGQMMFLSQRVLWYERVTSHHDRAILLLYIIVGVYDIKTGFIEKWKENSTENGPYKANG